MTGDLPKVEFVIVTNLVRHNWTFLHCGTPGNRRIEAHKNGHELRMTVNAPRVHVTFDGAPIQQSKLRKIIEGEHT